MKSQLLLAGMLLSTASAMADTAPEICESVANYAVKATNMTFQDGTWTDKFDPSAVRLKKDFKTYPMTVKDLGGCFDDTKKLPDAWCQVAGGSPEVYQIDVSRDEGKSGIYPLATVIVTYNRGGCWVDEVERK